MKTNRGSGRRTLSPGSAFATPSRWARKVFQPSRLAKLLRDVFSRRPSAPLERRAESRPLRRQAFMLEPMEPRLLLSADLSYTPAASNALATQFTLKAVTTTDLKLFDNLNNEVASATLNDGSVNIDRSALGDAFGDTIHLALDTFSMLDATSAGISGNGNLLGITFSGGDQRLFGDTVALDNGTSAALAFGLSITSNSHITASGTLSVAGDLSLTSEQTGIGGAIVSSQGLLANADTAITLTGAHLTASGNVTLNAHSNVDVNATGAETGNTNNTGHSSGSAADGIDFVSLVTSFDHTKIDIGGGSTLTATGGDITLNATVDGSLKGTADGNAHNLAIALLIGQADPEVLVHGASTNLSAGGKIDSAAISDITTEMKTSAATSDSTTASSFGAAVAITAFETKAILAVSDSAQLSAANATTLTASSKLNATNTADGTLGTHGGASVAVSVIFGDTTASVQNATVGGSSVAVHAGSERTIQTTAKSSPGGASANGGTSQGEQTLSSNNASTGSGQNISIAGAIAVGTDTGTTSSYLDSAVVNAGSGAATVSVGASDEVKVIADGSNTGDTSSTTNGVGIAVAIDVADRSDLAYVTGSTTITASSLSLQVLAPKQSSFDAEATSGVGSASNVAVAGSLAVNVVLTRHEAYIDQNAAVTLNGTTDVTVEAHADVVKTTKATASDGGGDAAKVGIGASVAFGYGEDTTAAYLGDNAGFVGSGHVHNLTLTADAAHEMATEAT